MEWIKDTTTLFIGKNLLRQRLESCHIRWVDAREFALDKQAIVLLDSGCEDVMLLLGQYTPICPVICLVDDDTSAREDELMAAGAAVCVDAAASCNEIEQVIKTVLAMNRRLRAIHYENRIALGYTDILLRAAHTLITANSSGELLQTVIDMLVEAFDAKCANYRIFDLEQRIVISAGYNSAAQRSLPSEAELVSETFTRGMDSLTGYAIRDRQPILSSGKMLDSREKPYVQQQRRDASIGALMVAPIISQTTVMGTIVITRSLGESDFTEADLNTFAAVANQLAFALVNVRTFEDTKERADTLALRVVERSVALAEKNAELKAVNEQLRELDRMKDKFVADVSHELRTPVSSLKLYLNLLERGSEQKRGRYINVLKQETDRLEGLVMDILRLTRLDLGKIKKEFAPVDLHTLIDKEGAIYQSQFDEAGIAFHLDLAAASAVVMGVEAQLSEMLAILLKNALSYTDEGSVTVCTVDEPDHVMIEVSDSGRGIPAESVGLVFGRLYRGSNAHDVPGAGLGLSILKAIIDLHQGDVAVESVEGQGTTFTVTLPYQQPLLEEGGQKGVEANGSENDG